MKPRFMPRQRHTSENSKKCTLCQKNRAMNGPARLCAKCQNAISKRRK